MKRAIFFLFAFCLLAIGSILGVFLLAGDKAGKERKQDLRSLPYASWSEPIDKSKASLSGVTIHDKGKASPGINAYIFQNEVHFFDMEGNFLHVITVTNRRAGNIAAFNLYDPQHVLAIVPSLRMVNSASEQKWKIPLNFHHDVAVHENGNIYSLTELPAQNQLISERTILDNELTIVSPEGEVLRRVSIGQMLAKDPELLAIAKASAIRDRDCLHTNTVEIVPSDVNDPSGLLKPGRVFFASRAMDLLGLIDLESEKIVWHWGPGELDGPHSPRLTVNNTLYIFDNGLLRRPYSRVLELDIFKKEIVWEYIANPPKSFVSATQGSIDPLPNGNMLITESRQGRAFELTPAKEIVWEFYNPKMSMSEIPGTKEQVLQRAAIPRMMRFSPEALGFISSAAQRQEQPLP